MGRVGAGAKSRDKRETSVKSFFDAAKFDQLPLLSATCQLVVPLYTNLKHLGIT